MELAAKAAALGVCAALMALLLKKSNAELALCLGLGAAAAILLAALGLAEDILDAAERARELSGLSPALFSPVVKCVGIGLICGLGSEACKDAGSGQLASAVELAGAAALGEESVTLEDLCEPYLMQMGFLTRTPRGRCATRLAYEHLGLKAPEAAAPEDNGQQSLF